MDIKGQCVGMGVNNLHPRFGNTWGVGDTIGAPKLGALSAGDQLVAGDAYSRIRT